MLNKRVVLGGSVILRWDYSECRAYLVECRLVRRAGTRDLDWLAVRAVYCAIAVTGACIIW
jgi:hypothetical protein